MTSRGKGFSVYKTYLLEIDLNILERNECFFGKLNIGSIVLKKYIKKV